jgi:hypothetical protein
VGVMQKGKSWSRDELVVIFNLYCSMSFGVMHSRNPRIIEIARARTNTRQRGNEAGQFRFL